MLISPQTLGKIEKIEARYRAFRFQTVAPLEAKYIETMDHLRAPPTRGNWKPMVKGQTWGAEGLTRWMHAEATLPPAAVGKRVFLRARTGGVESLVFVNGEPRGVFDGKPFNTETVNHTVVCVALKATRGQRLKIDLEAYAGHSHPGTQPNDSRKPVTSSSCFYETLELVVEDPLVSSLIFDLMALRQVMESLPEDSVRKHDLARVMEEIFVTLPGMPAEMAEGAWRPAVKKALQIMAPHLKAKRGGHPAQFGLMGHSHLDTAWLWTVDETTRKCARTFSSVLNLMDQYPEFRFLQTAPYHAEVVRTEYPSVWKGIQKQVKAGRWEPNGAMWLEPDGNVPSGESFARQLLYGQKFTREHFGYTGDTLWLPDVFGYSAALPQLLQLAGVKYFATTKMAWGEVKFPYSSFHWQGIDGTKVLSHLHRIHFIPDPKTLADQWHGTVQHKDVQDRVIAPFGFGDGGGGPHGEMIEMARRSRTADERYTAEYTTVTEFMKGLAKSSPRLPTWVGELYLSAHRGTLTSIAETKRLNRKSEFALRDAELLGVWASLSGKGPMNAPRAEQERLWKILLLNQFHDILPGSSIAEVNDRAARDLSSVVLGAEALVNSANSHLTEKSTDTGTVINTLSFARGPVVDLMDLEKGRQVAGRTSQSWVDVHGRHHTLVQGLHLPSMGTASIQFEKSSEKSGVKPSPFTVGPKGIDTPHHAITLDKAGRMVGCVLKESGRQLVKKGGVLASFRVAEDVPAAWDNWDVNEDMLLKEHEDHRLVKREVVSSGPLALVIRSHFRLGLHSSATQDVVFHSESPRIDFITRIDWDEKHTFLKAGFDLDVQSETARYEIQFGHLTRTRHRNLKEDQMKFEAPLAKWMDVSESRFGVAILNDGKYGGHAGMDRLTLSLLKSGTHPDARADKGIHRTSYAILPHDGWDSKVIQESYAFNVPVRHTEGSLAPSAPGKLFTVNLDHVVLESVKPAEDGRGLIVRLYEAEGTRARMELTAGFEVKSVETVNLLEDRLGDVAVSGNRVGLELHPFEVKSLRVIPD